MNIDVLTKERSCLRLWSMAGLWAGSFGMFDGFPQTGSSAAGVNGWVLRVGCGLQGRRSESFFVIQLFWFKFGRSQKLCCLSPFHFPRIIRSASFCGGETVRASAHSLVYGSEFGALQGEKYYKLFRRARTLPARAATGCRGEACRGTLNCDVIEPECAVARGKRACGGRAVPAHTLREEVR